MKKNDLNKTLTVLLIIFCTSLSISQTRLNYPKGIYKNVDEFMNKKPSVELKYKHYKHWDVTRLSIERKQTREIGDIFGFSDGENFYKKNMTTEHFNPRSIFTPLFQIEGILIYENNVTTYTAVNAVPMARKLSVITVIEKVSLKHIFFKFNKVKKLVKKDEKLFKEFKLDEDKYHKIFYYFVKYIKLNPHDNWQIAKKTGVISTKPVR